MEMARGLVALSLLLAACTPSGWPDGPPAPPTPRAQALSSCGNHEINGDEVCDGEAFRNGSRCSGYGLDQGQVTCTPTCQLDLSDCSRSDYCDANNLYGNGVCDPCERLGGRPDPDCAQVCAADGQCAERFEPLIGDWVCRSAGLEDPDCGTCGNNVIEVGELCDGNAFHASTSLCVNWGYLDGALGCRPDCSIDFSQCRAPTCGDGLVEGVETCEPSRIGPHSCLTEGFVGGRISCNSDCQLDTSACLVAGCGNGIREAAEACDGDDIADLACRNEGFSGGLIGCTDQCTPDYTSCVLLSCGDGAIDMAREDCEGNNLRDQSCTDLGFGEGTLACSPTSCTFDTSGCGPTRCGNGLLDPGEQCDGQLLGGRTCITTGFAAGEIACTETCQLDVRGCTNNPCGNGIADLQEVCDGTDFKGDSCFMRGFDHGALTCSADCQTIDASACQNVCGDGVVQALEICDGEAFRGTDESRECRLLGLGDGMVSCQANCTLDLSGCEADRCLAQGWYNDGICDACEEVGGSRDPDCDLCGVADGQCSTYYDEFTASYTCALVNPTADFDPDCPRCGNGVRDEFELCEGDVFRDFNQGFCSYYGFAGGEVRCSPDCRPDTSFCTP